MFKPEKSRKKENTFIAGQQTSDIGLFRSNSLVIDSADQIQTSYIKLRKIASLPTPGMSYRIITQRVVNSFDFVLSVLAREQIKTLYIACYRIGKKVTGELINLHKRGHIGNVHFILNSGIPQLTPEVYALIEAEKSQFWTYRTAHTHAKIILIHTDLNNFYVLEGSGNLSLNGTIEQYIFENNQDTYNFHSSWMKSI